MTIHLALVLISLGLLTLSNSYDGQLIGKALTGAGWWLMGIAQAGYWCASRSRMPKTSIKERD